jgi:peptide/nickel transport system permease protein
MDPSHHQTVAELPEERPFRQSMMLLWRDKFAFCAAVFLLVIMFCAVFGPLLFGTEATQMNLRARNTPPFSLEMGWINVLGTDTLGRSILARIIVGSQNTIAIAGSAVLISMTIGSFLGLMAGFRGGRSGIVIMRMADIVMSFPSLLLALIVLYVLGANVVNVVLVLAITRIPLYLRTSRAEVLEIRERMFVTAARVMGARPRRLVWCHIAPLVVPTMITLATMDFAFVMLAESSLTFLGLGIQPPEITWGLMVAEGRAYLATAWWVSFWPGVAITLATMSLNLLSNWVRIATDPVQRWRLEARESHV